MQKSHGKFNWLVLSKLFYVFSIILLRSPLHKGSNIPKPNPEFALNNPSDDTKYSQSSDWDISFNGETRDALTHLFYLLYLYVITGFTFNIDWTIFAALRQLFFCLLLGECGLRNLDSNLRSISLAVKFLWYLILVNTKSSAFSPSWMIE